MAAAGQTSSNANDPGSIDTSQQTTTTTTTTHTDGGDYQVVADSTPLPNTGGERLANIHVLRIRDGLIVESRDYHNHAAIAEMMG